MSVELSHRVGRIALQKPFVSLSYAERRFIGNAAFHAATFEELPDTYQRIILESEATRESAIAALREQRSRSKSNPGGGAAGR